METAWVTSKGQLVIPAKLRRRHNIKAGTRITFIEEGDRIVMQPVTREHIASFRGIFKRKPGEKPVTQELVAEHAEEARHQRPAKAQAAGGSAVKPRGIRSTAA